ncbi:hypothetical protein [Pedobacter sandarakinus]|uniref:hypothetical protein n=1 Tax=Pedobacter sandarakinus TaxID=353156 RepID=UPI00224800C0|nr:hypothetical protein [Pedobacter sandarakinus]MCX2574865.1 hypothetical protein [Pedobacter sandarakinus]
MFNNTEFDNFKKITLKRLKPILKIMDITVDFVEISTSYLGKSYEVRVMGVRDGKGKWSWDLVRVVNRSVIPSQGISTI